MKRSARSVEPRTPNDPFFSSSNSWGQGHEDLWGLKKINAEQNGLKGPTKKIDFNEITSEKKEDQVQALRKILPAKEDVETLFPAHAEKLWPRMEAGFQIMEKNADKVAQEMLAKGGLQAVELKDLREKEGARRALELLPKGVPAYDYVTRYERGSSGGGSYVHVRGRWVLIRNLASLPEMLEKMK